MKETEYNNQPSSISKKKREWLKCNLSLKIRGQFPQSKVEIGENVLNK